MGLTWCNCSCVFVEVRLLFGGFWRWIVASYFLGGGCLGVFGMKIAVASGPVAANRRFGFNVVDKHLWGVKNLSKGEPKRMGNLMMKPKKTNTKSADSRQQSCEAKWGLTTSWTGEKYGEPLLEDALAISHTDKKHHNHEAHVFFMQILRTASAGSQVSRIDLMDYTFSPAGGERQLVMQALTIFFFHCPGCPVLT